MRVEPELAVVRVQHGQRAGCARELVVVLAEGLEGVPGAAHQQLVDQPLVRPGQGAQLGGQCEGHQKVGGGHQGLELALQPQRALKVLAVRASPVATGVRQAGLRVAGRQHVGSEAGAAGSDETPQNPDLSKWPTSDFLERARGKAFPKSPLFEPAPTFSTTC